MLAVLGAGSVGLWLAARLARAGEDVCILTRSAAQAADLQRQGIEAEDLGSRARWTARVNALPLAEVHASRLGPAAVLLCTRSDDTASAIAALADRASPRTVLCVQNGVDNETIIAQRLPRVVGVVFRNTATRFAPTRVRGLGRGRLVLGLHPRGSDAEVDDLARVLARAEFHVGVSDRIQADKWLKLCINLMSAPNALVRRDDHTTRAFVEVKARLLEEARDVLRAARIEAASGDGRDRSLDEEIAYQWSALERGRSARTLPLYNHVWTALRSGAPLESDRFHQRILELAAEHAIAAPVNESVLAALRRSAERRLGPESWAAEDLLWTPSARLCHGANPPDPT